MLGCQPSSFIHVRFGELFGASSRSHAACIVNYRCHNAVFHTIFLSQSFRGSGLHDVSDDMMCNARGVGFHGVTVVKIPPKSLKMITLAFCLLLLKNRRTLTGMFDRFF
jgi:hypothetical protein